jgi:iduronate 2-sulfatase
MTLPVLFSNRRVRIAACCRLLMLAIACLLSSSAVAAQPNVLFLAIDDLRPALGCYGDPLAKTPHIDRLAASSRLFLAAYCNQAVCGPSRTAVFTGRLPDNTRVWHNRHRFRDYAPALVTLPEFFKAAGYHTQSIGKTFSGDEREDDPQSWSVPAVLSVPGVRNYARVESTSKKGKGVAAEAADVVDQGYPDGRLADLAVETLSALKDADQPFFLAVGFLKPHLPFNAPKRYWDLHAREAFLAVNKPDRTTGVPNASYPDHAELGGYRGISSDEQLSAEQTAELRHGYYACVSYVDAQVGRVLAAVAELELDESTIVVLWGDHGYSLGEGDHWCKATNFERDTRVPLLIRFPGMPLPGAPTSAIIEYVDLYPTVAALAGLSPPATLDGTSLLPILMDPAAAGRDAALSQYQRPWKAKDPQLMGYSLRTATHRYTRWIEWPAGPTIAEELYDYGRLATAEDGGAPFVEVRNQIDDAEHSAIRNQLREHLDTMLTRRIAARAVDSDSHE